MGEPEVVWRPNAGPQTAYIACPVFEVFFGGARGGGKTQGTLGEWLNHAQEYGERANGLMVRRTLTELQDTIRESKAIYGKLGATYNETGKCWTMADGGKLTFAFLEDDSDAERYQGWNLTRLYVEEIGNFPRPEPIFRLMATLRGKGVRVGMRATGNPGGPGHQWVKARYIDPAPYGYQVVKDAVSGLERVFIPSRVTDNPALMDADPGYVNRLRASGSRELVRAWLEGDWSVIQGAYFPEFEMGRHVCAPVALPEHWVRFRSIDWGSAAPFSVGWWAVSDGSMAEFAKGCIVRYREWYGMQPGRPNVGVKLTAEEVGTGIREREARGEQIDMSVIDPAAFANHGGPTIAERLAKCGVYTQRADNTRVGVRGAMTGWDLVRARLKGDGDGRPMLVLFSTCVDSIRTLPALQHDPMRPEDVDTDGEDHAADDIRYACAARPWLREAPKPTGRVAWPTGVVMKDGDTPASVSSLIDSRRRARLEAE